MASPNTAESLSPNNGSIKSFWNDPIASSNFEPDTAGLQPEMEYDILHCMRLPSVGFYTCTSSCNWIILTAQKGPVQIQSHDGLDEASVTRETQECGCKSAHLALIRCEMKNPLATIPFQLNKLSILCGYHIDLLQLKSGISDPGFTVVGCSNYYSLAYQLVFPSLYKGHMAFTFSFSLCDKPGRTDGLLVGLQRDQLQLVLADLKSHEEFGDRGIRESTVIHPVSFFGCLLKTLSHEDAKKIYERVVALKQLERSISPNAISQLGKTSIELNELRSDLSTLRTVTDFVHSLTETLENVEVVSDRDFTLKLIDFPTKNTSWKHLNDSLCRAIDDLREVRRSCQSRRLDIQCLQQSIEINLAVISNLTAQSNIEWNKRVAEATRRDSSAMKVIAILGLVFLPGTFISTLFAMPLFNWDMWSPSSTEGRRSVMKPGFWIYWIITIPITVFLVLCFNYYVKSQKWKEWEDEEKGFTERISPKGENPIDTNEKRGEGHQSSRGTSIVLAQNRVRGSTSDGVSEVKQD